MAIKAGWPNYVPEEALRHIDDPMAVAVYVLAEVLVNSVLKSCKYMTLAEL